MIRDVRLEDVSELSQAGKIIAKRLRELPFRNGSRITTWQAVVEQRAEGKREGSFSALRAVGNVVKEYIASLPEEKQRQMWEETGDSKMFPTPPDTEILPKLLYPWVCQAADKPIHRAVVRRMDKIYEETIRIGSPIAEAPPESPATQTD